MPGIYDRQIKARIAVLIIWIVSALTALRIWFEARRSEAVAHIFTRTYATYGGRRLVCAFASSNTLPTRPGSSTVDAAAISSAGATDVTADMAYLLSAHAGAAPIGAICRRLSCGSFRPSILIVYIADTSFGLSREVIDLEEDTEVLTRTDLSAINLATLPVLSVCAL